MQTSMIFSGNSRFPTSHSSTICELSNGDLLVTWFAGQREGSPDSVILSSRLLKGETEWSEPEIHVDVYQHAAGNPRVFIGPDNGLWLIAPVNYGEWCSGGTRLFMKRSYDNGYSWTDLEILIDEPRILGKNKPVAVTDDIWIIPVEYEGYGEICYLRSENKGLDWKIIDVENDGLYLDQPCIALLDNGELLSLIRTWEGYLYETRSTDQGLTWSYPKATSLKNPNSGIDLVNIKNDKLVLVYNPTALGLEGNLTSDDVEVDRTPILENQEALIEAGNYELDRMIDKIEPKIEMHEGGYLPWGPRSPLSVAISIDNGKTWKDVLVLEDEPGEFSYPAIIIGRDDTLHISYTYQRTGIKYARITFEEIS